MYTIGRTLRACILTEWVVYEFLIEQNVPLHMHQFTTAVLDDGGAIYAFTPVFSDKILNHIWKLLDV